MFFKHVYWAIRYGEWDWGWELYKGKPLFGCFYVYHDGNNFVFHLGPLWVGVLY